MSFGKRIKQFIDYKGLSVRSFEIQSTLKNGAIYRVIRNGTSLNGDSIAALGNSWEELNLNWLMIGVGDMLVDENMVLEPGRKYQKSSPVSNDVEWCRQALERADEQIKLQKEMIDALKLIIEKQKKAAEKAGIEL